MNDITNQFAAEDIEKNKVVAGLSYFGILFFLAFGGQLRIPGLENSMQIRHWFCCWPV